MWKETVVVRYRQIRGVTEETTCVDEDRNFENSSWLCGFVQFDRHYRSCC